MDLALDRARIAAAASPYAVPTNRVVPKGILGGDPAAVVLGPSRDVEEARRLLEAAGYARAFDVGLHGIGLYGGYASADVDRAIEEANVVLKPRERLPLLQKAVRLVEEERWWIPLYHNQAPFVVDRALVFEPRADLYLRYAQIGGAVTPP